METKICKKCGKELPMTEFYANMAYKDGFFNICKKCHNAQVIAMRKARRASGGGNLKKVYSNPDLASFTPKQLMDELAARGYHASGKVTKDFSF